MFRLVWKTCYIYIYISICVFFFVFIVSLVSLGFDSLGLIQINPNQIWFILPQRHYCEVITKKYCMLNMRNIPWGCAIFLFRCEAFEDVKLCFWWRKPSLQINGVPVPVERSWSSLTGVLHIYTEMVWLKGLLHIFKSWCNFQKMRLIQFWWVKHFLHSMLFLPNRWQLGFFERSVTYIF